VSPTGGRSATTDAELYRASTAMLAELGLEPTFTLDELHRHVEERRGRPVHLIARDLPALAPHGLWIAGEQADYVFYDASAPAIRRHQIIGHELGHVLFDDALPAHGIEQLTRLLMPDLDTSTVRARGRTSYELPAERRAEVFGTVVVTRLHSWQPPRPETSGDDVATRVSGALEGGRHKRS
jgi:hypothetical protein